MKGQPLFFFCLHFSQSLRMFRTYADCVSVCVCPYCPASAHSIPLVFTLSLTSLTFYSWLERVLPRCAAAMIFPLQVVAAPQDMIAASSHVLRRHANAALIRLPLVIPFVASETAFRRPESLVGDSGRRQKTTRTRIKCSA